MLFAVLLAERIASRCFNTLRQLRSVRRQVPGAVFQSLATAFVLGRLDWTTVTACWSDFRDISPSVTSLLKTMADVNLLNVQQ